MPEMPGDGVDEEALAIRIPIMPPGIGGAIGEHLHNFALGMIPPKPAFDRHAQLIRRAGHTEPPRAGMTAATVKPAIRPPAQAVGEVMVVGLRHGEAIKHHLGWTIGHIVSIFVW